MWLRQVNISQFKGIRSLKLDFQSGPNRPPRGVTCVVGDNGTGKTSLLQAIAWVLCEAMGKPFAWNGFLLERLGSQGKTVVELEVEIGEEERKHIAEAGEEWEAHMIDKVGSYSVGIVSVDQPIVRLSRDAVRLSSDTWNLRGRFFVQEAAISRPTIRRHLPFMGDLLWFDQFRGLPDPSRESARPSGAGLLPDIPMLRNKLNQWYAYHRSENLKPELDYFARLQSLLSQVFPEIRLIGPEPRPDESGDMFFLLEREGRRFDLAELSSGEQAVFSLLYPFAHQQIHHSIILIDELDMHLHPPAQIQLLRAIRKLSGDNQFIFTTHSEHVVGAITEQELFRMPQGDSWL